MRSSGRRSLQHAWGLAALSRGVAGATICGLSRRPAAFVIERFDVRSCQWSAAWTARLRLYLEGGEA